MQGYCVNCKKITDVKDEQSTKLANGKRVTKGKCTICDTEIWKKES